MQKEPNTTLRDLLKSQKAETRKLSELSKTEQNRLVNLNGMLDELRRGENVQNRRLAISWLKMNMRVLRLIGKAGSKLEKS